MQQLCNVANRNLKDQVVIQTTQTGPKLHKFNRSKLKLQQRNLSFVNFLKVTQIEMTLVGAQVYIILMADLVRSNY